MPEILAFCKEKGKEDIYHLCFLHIYLFAYKGLNVAMEAKDIRKANIKALVRGFGSIKDLAEKVDTDPNYISTVLSTKPSPKVRNPGTKLTRKIEEKLGFKSGLLDRVEIDNVKVSPERKDVLSFEIRDVSDKHETLQSLVSLIKATPSDVDVKFDIISAEQEAGSEETTSEAAEDLEETGRKLAEEFVLVPRYDIKASMGPGQLVHSEQVVDHLAFKRNWVHAELGVNPRNLALISTIGDSMEPTLRPGDLILLDRSVDHVKSDSIYVIAIDGELLAKRIQRRFDGSLVIKSDNPAYDPQTLNPEQALNLRVIGRVVWAGRRM